MNKRFVPLIVVLLGLLITSCNPEPKKSETLKSQLAKEQSSEAVGDWIKVYLQVETDLAGFRPSATARANAYVHMAAYHAAHPGMPTRKDINTLFPDAKLPVFQDGANEYHWPAAVNAAYRVVLDHFLINASAESKALIQKTYDKWNDQYKNEVDPAIVERSSRWGVLVANAVIDYARKDAQAEAQILDPRPASYIPPVGTGLWVDSDGPALFPYWGSVKSFGTFNFDDIVQPPLPISTDANSAFYKQAVEVNNVIGNLTRRDRAVAEFWSDDIVGLTFSPPARSFAIAEQLMQQEDMNLDKALFMCVKLGLASNDAAAICWYAKYKYNLIRPEDYIKNYINPQFETILGDAIGSPGITPPFPAYPSGHSTFAGIMAGIFIDELGEGYAFTDRCHEGRTEFAGTPRSYVSFRTMAEENAYSRIPLGVHFRMDCDEGLRLGYIVSDNINRMFDR